MAKNQSVLDRWNQRLAKLMGKKDRPQRPEPNLNDDLPTGNQFLALILGMLLVLWALTGIYYVPDGNYGIVIVNGKINKVAKGLTVGFSWPFPISDVITLDAAPINFSIGGADDAGMQITTQDKQKLAVVGSASFIVTDPKTYFLNYYQEISDINQKVNWLTTVIVQDYFLHLNSSDALSGNTIVFANNIRKLSDAVLQPYGLQIDKFNIQSIARAQLAESQNQMGDDKLGKLIISQALEYQTMKAAETESIVADFKEFQPQFSKNKEMVKKLLYYRMLSNITHKPDDYQLLNLDKDKFTQLESNSSPFSDIKRDASTTGNFRSVNRSINRQRDLGE